MAQAKRCRVDLDGADSELDDSDGSVTNEQLAAVPTFSPALPPALIASAAATSNSAAATSAVPGTRSYAHANTGDYPQGTRENPVEVEVEAVEIGTGTEEDFSKGDDGDEDSKEAGSTCSMLALPNEVLAAIMQQHSFTEVAESFRLVCRRFAQVSAIVLNAGLYRVGQALETALTIQEANMEAATTDNEMSVAARAFCALEFARMQWRLIEATVWRHGAEAFGQTTGGGSRACCFGGRLLDRLRDLCTISHDDPVGLAWSFHYGSALRTTSARRRLAHDTKRFLNVYEKYAENNINAGPRVCGSKLVDLLLSLEDEKCIQIDEKATGVDADTGLFRLRATFILPRAWFTCLRVESPTVEHGIRERHRYMFLRMRRLVTACNESTLERIHYEREMLMRMHTPWRTSVVQPLASKYAAFGHYADEFFYYGALNERAFDDRFRSDPLLEILGPSAAEGLSPVPAMEVQVQVRLVCPPSLAPLAVLRRLRFEDFDPVATHDPHGPFALEMDIHCSASAENRLPPRFQWRVSDDDGDAEGNWLTTACPPPPTAAAPDAPPPPPPPPTPPTGSSSSSSSSNTAPAPMSGRRLSRSYRHGGRVSGRSVHSHVHHDRPNVQGT